MTEVGTNISPLLVPLADVAKLVSIKKRTLWRMLSAGTFPGPDKKIGGKIRLWHVDTVAQWAGNYHGKEDEVRGVA